jgi:hypothetical protein
MAKVTRTSPHRTLTHVVVLGLCFAGLTGCGGGSSSGVEGDYFLQMGSNAGEGMTLQLKSGGAWHSSIPGMMEADGTYTVDGARVIATTANGRVETYTLVDGNLKGMMANEEVVFEKQ